MAHLAVDPVAASFPGWIMATQDPELLLNSAWLYNSDVHCNKFYHSASLQLLASCLMSSQNQSDNTGLASNLAAPAARSCDNTSLHLPNRDHPCSSNYNHHLDYPLQPYINLPANPTNRYQSDSNDDRPLIDLVNKDSLRWFDSEETAAMYSQKPLGHEVAATAVVRPGSYNNSAGPIGPSYVYTSTDSRVNPAQAGLASPTKLSPIYSSAGSSPCSYVIEGADLVLLQQSSACELSSSAPPSGHTSSRGDITSVPYECNSHKMNSLTSSNSSTVVGTAPAPDHTVISTSSQQVVADGEANNNLLQAAQDDGRTAITTTHSRKRRSRASLDPGFEPEFIHVRAKRGQATDSHSLAERVRRERINQRMKRLQELVPSCHKITGKAMVLDEIINYIKSLQHQVEFLSMRLATVSAIRSSQ